MTTDPDASFQDRFPTLESAEAAYAVLLADIQSIQKQLGIRKEETIGERLPREEYRAYLEWRTSAKTALDYKIKEYQKLKDWMHRKRMLAGQVPGDTGWRQAWETFKSAGHAFRLLNDRFESLVHVLRSYERWEAELIEVGSSRGDGAGGVPTLTPELWARLEEIRAIRDDVLGRDPSLQPDREKTSQLGAKAEG